MNTSRRRFLAATGAMLAGCGGGSVQYVGGPPALYRPGILYGYFGDGPLAAAETVDHTNLYWVAPWWGLGGSIANMDRAKKAGFRDFVMMPEAKINGAWGSIEQTIDAINAWMAAMQEAGVLDGATLQGLYWCDEPNGLADAFVRGVNRGLRGITSAPLWTIFADSPGRPALDAAGDPASAWDVVGIDQYDIGCQVLGGLNDELRKAMKLGARRILVPGPVGGHLSQADPACFENYAYANADVLAIVPFIWVDGWGGAPSNLGIRSLPSLRATYTALGKRLTGKP